MTMITDAKITEARLKFNHPENGSGLVLSCNFFSVMQIKTGACFALRITCQETL